MASSKVFLRTAFLIFVLVIALAVSHKAKEESPHPNHHEHGEHGHHHEKTLMDEAKQFAHDHADEAKKAASAGIHMMIMGFIYSAISFILRWSIYIAIAGGVIYYFVTKRGAATGATGGAGQGTQHRTGHARSD